MHFHLQIPSTPPSLSNGYASHHKDFMSSLSYSNNHMGSAPHSPPNNHLVHSGNLSTCPTDLAADTLSQPPPHLHNGVVDHHSIKTSHMMFPHPSSSGLHSLAVHPSPAAPIHPSYGTHTVIPNQLSSGQIGMLAGQKTSDFHPPPALSHTPVIIAE